MLSLARHGWEPGAPPSDTAAILAEALDAATADPLFGLPAFARKLAPGGVLRRKLVVLGHNAFSTVFLKTYGPEGVLAFVADDRLGTLSHGVPCISSAEFLERYRGNRDIVAINCACFDRGIRHFEQLAIRAGVEVLTPEQAHRALQPPNLDYRLADHMPAIVTHRDRYARLEGRLADEHSRETLRRVLLFHLTTQKEFFRHVERPYETLYFRTGLFEVTPAEQFVDCGASLGESISGVLGLTGYRCERAWLFEPDRYNGETLARLLGELALLPTRVTERITLHRQAVGERPGLVPFAHEGGHGGFVMEPTGHAVTTIHDPVELVRLDDVVDGAPTLIKMDIEGSELGALRGAAGLIARYKPRLAVSAYHRADDLVELSEYVLSLRPDYRVGLRHHTPVRWDTCLYFY